MAIILTIMAKPTTPPLPALQRILSDLGEHIRLARLRRRFSADLVAKRAGMTRTTLRSIERGDPRVTLGAYANVLYSLGLADDLKLLARDDELGHKLQDAELPIKARAPRIRASTKASDK
jgi:transcriptional regulator with XRE-family HTH domain